MSCTRTTFCSIFDRNGRFETGRQFFIWLGSRLVFLSTGLTTAALNSDGTSPDRSDLFMTFVRAGRRSMFSRVVMLAVGQVNMFSVRVFCCCFFENVVYLFF